MTAIETSNKMLQLLEIEMSKVIMKFEKDNNYQLKSYEVDLLLLKKLTENQMRYRKDKLGS